MKISYAITVKDEILEITNLVNLLSSKIDQEDEIIIVWDEHNGSSEVKNYLDSLNIPSLKIGKFWFNNNFSDLKNHLNSLCTGEYIFNIDADELLNQNIFKQLKPLLASNQETDLFYVPRINTVDGLTPQHIQKWGWRVDELGWVNYPDYQARLYKNKPEIRWQSNVHEQIVGAINKMALPKNNIFSIRHHKKIIRQEKQNELYEQISTSEKNYLESLLTPYTINLTKKRYGKHYDGGYILYKELVEQTDSVLSLGVDKDTSFEDAILEDKQIKIHMYDGSVEHSFENEYFKFNKLFINSSNFSEEIEKTGNTNNRNILLKCDIEGGEYELFLNMDENILKKFSQICLEVHSLSANKHLAKLMFEKINNNFTLFHVHANNYGPRFEEIPEVLELSYVRNDFCLNKQKLAVQLPDPELDSPNNKSSSDYILSWWLK